MPFREFVFIFLLFACVVYASLFGGKTGRWGAAIFVGATVLSNVAARFNPDWASPSYGVFWVDMGCMTALLVLASNSNRYWPIWALGFQIVSVATHFAMMIAPDIVPVVYQSIESFWSIPILGVMVLGTTFDWHHSRES